MFNDRTADKLQLHHECCHNAPDKQSNRTLKKDGIQASWRWSGLLQWPHAYLITTWVIKTPHFNTLHVGNSTIELVVNGLLNENILWFSCCYIYSLAYHVLLFVTEDLQIRTFANKLDCFWCFSKIHSQTFNTTYTLLANIPVTMEIESRQASKLMKNINDGGSLDAQLARACIYSYLHNFWQCC